MILKNSLISVAFIILLFSCSRSFYQGHNEGSIEIKIDVIAGKDGKIRTPDGNVIGTINEKGKVFDLAGNKIGERKPTTAELMEHYEKWRNPYE